MNSFTVGVLRFNEDVITSGSFYIVWIFTQPLRKDNFAGDVSFLYCSLGKSTHPIAEASQLQEERERERDHHHPPTHSWHFKL